jgi:hypothetical protein
MTSTQLVWPKKTSSAKRERPSRFPMSVQGKRVIVLNNGWGSFDDLAECLSVILKAEYGAATVVSVRNDRHTSDSSFGPPSEFLDELAAAGDVVISGLGNCGGCTAWTCDASVGVERRGTPSAAVVTGLFGPLAEFNLVHTNRAPDHELVVLAEGFEYTSSADLLSAARAIAVRLFAPDSSVEAVERQEEAAWSR